MAEKDPMQNNHDSTENQANIDLNTDENMSGTTHLNEPVEEESQTEKLKAELQDSKDKFLRLAAEFDNYKRRTARERIELSQTAGREIILDMLDVLDDADRAQKQMEGSSDLEALKEGLNLVFNKFRHTLQSKGLKPMETVGIEFNPDLHEAITEIPAPGEEYIGKVVDEVVKGYYLNDKIIRHAKVVVGK